MDHQFIYLGTQISSLKNGPYQTSREREQFNAFNRTQLQVRQLSSINKVLFCLVQFSLDFIVQFQFKPRHIQTSKFSFTTTSFLDKFTFSCDMQVQQVFLDQFPLQLTNLVFSLVQGRFQGLGQVFKSLFNTRVPSSLQTMRIIRFQV